MNVRDTNKSSIHRQNYTHVCFTCGKINWQVCLHASTHDLRSFRTFSRSSGESLDEPMCISKSRNSATWLFISTISCGINDTKYYYNENGRKYEMRFYVYMATPSRNNYFVIGHFSIEVSTPPLSRYFRLLLKILEEP